MTTKNMPTDTAGKTAGKAGKIIYWIATLWLALGLVATGAGQLFKMKSGQGGVEMITHLGYPVYLLTILGIWKILAVIALLVPKFPLLKEWTYAGIFFLVSGAMYSHIAIGDPMTAVFPSLLLLILLVVSWYFRDVYLQAGLLTEKSLHKSLSAQAMEGRIFVNH